MMSPMWRFCSASSSGATFAPIASQWNLRNRRQQTLQCISDDGTATLILILSDINMPGMSGLELLPKAKALRPDIPVIMTTAYGDAETKRKALENGAEALLTNPIDFVMLRNEIDLRVEPLGGRAIGRIIGFHHVLKLAAETVPLLNGLSI
jgi:CheY-like chemotaxis protein